MATRPTTHRIINKAIALAAMAFAKTNESCPWFAAQSFNLAAPPIHHPSSLSAALVSSASSTPSITLSRRHQYRSRTHRSTNVILSAASASARASLPKINKPKEGEETGPRNDTDATSNAAAARRNSGEILFRKRLAELVDFRSLHGHGSIPTPYPPNPPLGVWAANLRRHHAARERTVERGRGAYLGYLTPDRLRRLRSAGFDFASLTERQFRVRLRELEAFKERYGHCMVPEKWEENAALGAWVSNLRSLYKRRRRSRMQQQQPTPSQSQQDGEGGITENDDQKRKRSYNILRQPIYPIKKQARTPRFSHLDEERIKLLEDMGFVWSSKDQKWLEMLEWAKFYGVINSKCGEGLGDIAYDDDNRDDHLKLSVEGDGGDYDVNLERNGTHHQIDQNHTILLDNYHKFVQDIQNQSLLPEFHPQDKILTLLSEESDARNGQRRAPAAEQPFNHTGTARQTRPSSKPKKDAQQQSMFEPSFLDYRISPNDTVHYPLRIWMANQRSNYNRLRPLEDGAEGNDPPSPTTTASPSAIPSTMTEQRRLALEEIHFPWSGRFRNGIEQVRHADELVARQEKREERERRKEQKEREERERVEKILATPIVPAGPRSGAGEAGEGGGSAAEPVVDVMALWDAEDDDDDDW